MTSTDFEKMKKWEIINSLRNLCKTPRKIFLKRGQI